MIRPLTTLFALLVLLTSLTEETLAHEGSCNELNLDDTGTGTCDITSQQQRDETETALLGLNALPARIAVVTGQIQVPPTCGVWCDTTPDPSSPCRMDEDVVPCKTDFYCTTTCALWSLFTGIERPSTSCAMFVRFDGYSTEYHGAEPCDEMCLLPEIRKERYPAPTGIGLFCQTGTCYPFVSSMAHLAEVAAVLECPCNWFGADCPDDWAPVQAIDHTAIYGDIVATTLTVNVEDWKRIIDNHQPGGVIRIVQRDPADPVSGRVREQPYALAYAPSEGKLEILTAPPDMSLHPIPREVAERVRSLPSGPIAGGNLFVNPSIAGFFNKEWTYLLDEIKAGSGDINRLVVLSTGAGLSGALSAVEAVIALGLLKDIHVYHGLRYVENLPYKDRLNELAISEKIDLAIIESQSSSGMISSRGGAEPEGIVGALQRGSIASRLVHAVAQEEVGGGGKVYVQHAMRADLMPAGKAGPGSGGALFEKGAALKNTVFVVCGRMALLEDSYSILKSTFCSTDTDTESDCDTNLLGRRFFTNI